VVAWRKAQGAPVARGDVIAEVETDKATMELEAFASGVLLEIRVETGETVPVGTVIGLIGEAGETVQAGESAAREVDIEGPEVKIPAVEKLADDVPKEIKAETAQADRHKAETGLTAPAGEVLVAPIVRRRAQELGIDLAQVRGSGPAGRVLLEDLVSTNAGQRPAPVEQGDAAEIPEDKASS